MEGAAFLFNKGTHPMFSNATIERNKATLKSLIDQMINAGLIALVGCSITAALAIGASMSPAAADSGAGVRMAIAFRPTYSAHQVTSHACSAWSAPSMRRSVKAGASSPSRFLTTVDRAQGGP